MIRKIPIDKPTLRQMLLERREALTEDEIEAMSRNICRRIINSRYFAEADAVAGYAPFRGEVSDMEILREARLQGKEVFLPRIRNHEMDFFSLEEFDSMQRGAFGIPEPVGGEPLSGRKALMLVPGVVFDERGFRIGYGGGYYDRYLQSHRGLTTVGLCYEMQMLPEIPTQDFDRPVQAVVTEKRLIQGGNGVSHGK